MIEQLLGNEKLLEIKKTTFLCSRNIPASAVLKCYDWAIEQREAGNCIISGFQSQLEKDVFHYLLKGKQSIIIALARGLKKRLEPELIKPLEEGRLLIISPFDASVTRVTAQTAKQRNLLMLSLAENVCIGYASKNGHIEELLKTNNKPVKFL